MAADAHTIGLGPSDMGDGDLTVVGSALYATLFARDEVAPLFSDGAEVAGLVLFEAALAIAEDEAGLVPAGAGRRIAAELATIVGAPGPDLPGPAAFPPLLAAAGRGAVPGIAALVPTLVAGTASSGMPIPALVAQLRETVPVDVADLVHHGATSQDAIDTGLMLRLAAALDTIERHRVRAVRRLSALAETHRATPFVARTRWQAAAPTSLGLKVAGWLDPLVRLGERLAEARPRLLAVQLGGSVGNRAHLGPAGGLVADGLARTLGLTPAHPWHGARDRLEELSGWLAALSTTCGKIASDLLMMAQSEIGEVRLDATGGSSTLPHKQNPVSPEIVVALARHAAGLPGALHQAAIGAHERDGAAWTAEWLVLPDLVMTTHGAIAVLAETLEGLTFETDRMGANIDRDGGLVHAEAAAFALAGHMPRGEAQRLVKAAVAARGEPGFDLLDRLAATTDAPVDWADIRAAGVALRSAGPMIDAVLHRAGGAKATGS